MYPFSQYSLKAGPPRGFRGPGPNLPNEAPCVGDRRELKEQKAKETKATESGGTLRTLYAAPIGNFLEYIYRGYK